MSRYAWIVERARAGEPVPIDTTRRDMARVWDFLTTMDGRGLTIQLDNTNDLLWVVRTDAV